MLDPLFSYRQISNAAFSALLAFSKTAPHFSIVEGGVTLTAGAQLQLPYFI